MFLNSEEIKHNQSIVEEISNFCNCDILADLQRLLDHAHVTGKLDIVNTPCGEQQNEKCGVFEDVHVDQWSVGDSGDSFEGFVYGRFGENKWIKIPYYC